MAGISEKREIVTSRDHLSVKSNKTKFVQQKRDKATKVDLKSNSVQFQEPQSNEKKKDLSINKESYGDLSALVKEGELLIEEQMSEFDIRALESRETQQ